MTIFMNKHESDILELFLEDSKLTQRQISERIHLSLGLVNKTIKSLKQKGYLSNNNRITNKLINLAEKTSPKSAVILAAGSGMRMVPINVETSKGILRVKGEILIERLIKQLHEAGISDIFVIVGFMKEKYEYLIDKFHVELIVNSKYSEKNNLYSVKLAEKKLANCYIIPCDLYFQENPFSKIEFSSWYMVSDFQSDESSYRINRKYELVKSKKGNRMIGLCYLTSQDAKMIRERIDALCSDSAYDQSFWEKALEFNNKLCIPAKEISDSDVIEINTYEQLRTADSKSDHLNNQAIDIICKTLKIVSEDIHDINTLKKGMTNRSFIFTSKGSRYIMRIPGEGTGHLINRNNECGNYLALKGMTIVDEPLYIDSSNGYKLTRFIEGSHPCDAHNFSEVSLCMDKLRSLHEANLYVDHEFSLFDQIEFYESLWPNKTSAYSDYETTKKNVMKLRKYIEQNIEKKTLCHIDAIPDNFLLKGNDVFMIDWEYSGMQDPHIDIAMFCIYSMYDQNEIDKLIDLYFKNKCPKNIRLKIYCYVSACGLLWSNWCEYKYQLGIDFGEYSLRQYRYAKEYYRLTEKELGEFL